MIRSYGPARQNGIVVRDLDDALEYWTTRLGVGPFFRMNDLQNEFFFDREIQAPSPPMSVALANWGDLQIELICPHGDNASTWHQFLAERGGGIHHVSVWAEDYDGTVSKALNNGLALEARGKVIGGARYAYFTTDAPDRPLLEIAELTPDVAGLFTMIRDASIDWDGSDPIRPLN